MAVKARIIVNMIKQDQNIRSEMHQGSKDENREIIKLMLVGGERSDNDSLLASLSRCWVDYFSTFYIFWEILHIVAILAGLQNMLILYSFKFIPLEKNGFEIIFSWFIGGFFIIDFFLCFVKQY